MGLQHFYSHCLPDLYIHVSSYFYHHLENVRFGLYFFLGTSPQLYHMWCHLEMELSYNQTDGRDGHM